LLPIGMHKANPEVHRQRGWAQGSAFLE
jgi:hypothetical protein